jgi:hypothetical protein
MADAKKGEKKGEKDEKAYLGEVRSHLHLHYPHTCPAQ